MNAHFARYYRLYFWALVLLGAVQSLLYATTVIRHPDHIQLLYKGVQWAHFNHWIPYGNLVTGGGVVPGGLSSLLIGLPLKIYDGMLSVNIVILIFHLLALFCMNEALKGYFSPLQRLAFVALFWLTPWRASKAVIWNPSYLYFAMALHFWTAEKLSKYKSQNLELAVQGGRCKSRTTRVNPQKISGFGIGFKGFVLSALHIFAIGFAFQLHASSVILAVTSMYLYLRKHIKINLLGAFTAVGLVLLSLVPYYLELQNNPGLMPVVDSSKEKFFYGKSLVYVYPFIKGILYWCRYTSMLFPKFVYSGLDFSFLDEGAVRTSLSFVFNGLKHVAGVISMVFSLWSLGWWIRRVYQKRTEKFYFASFVDNYVLAVFCAVVIVTAISPMEFSHWHLMLVLPVACVSFFRFLIDKKFAFQNRTLVWVVVYFIIFNFVAALSSRDHNWKNNLTQDYPSYRDEQIAKKQ